MINESLGDDRAPSAGVSSHHEPEPMREPYIELATKDTPVDVNSVAPEEVLWTLRIAAHYAGLVPSAMVGSLIRIGLEAIGTYDHPVIFPLAWAQGVGCGIMGIAVARKNQYLWWYPPIHTFIGTGIAGCVTTFSSWMLEGFLSFSNFEGYKRGGFHDTVDGVAYSLSTLAISIACLSLGHHVASFLPTLPTPTPLRRQERTLFRDAALIIIAAVSYFIILMIYFLGPIRWRHRVLFALLLAPPGAMLRYFLSKLNTLKPINGRFPLGTFLANMIATLLIAGVYVAQRRPSASIPVRCDALYAIQQGFCGCLSTVSTFANELVSIKKRRWRWVYLFTSVIFGHLLVLAVVGGVRWGPGYGEACRGTDP